MDGKLTRATEVERVSELLGLPEEINDRDSLIAQVTTGLPTKSVEKILEVMNSQPVLNLIPERAFRRAKAGKIPLSPDRSKVLYDFARAYVAADKTHSGNGALVMRFLEKPNPDLGGAAPMALAISSPAGADAVIELLSR
ncbi:antitoxin Xre/MbcA/ParS toxin-binding domain-containing protein [Roseovarius arcticus]|uniref:antitoxin Xre/MbcA/ParS toxin-binding domain-containing protein n=1 Tax=Roseovarius arcticus TaxID=2547404 RepID=UPI0011102169|nr:antitoxin Xre/MbcA/ParS toxin-binding domain-containing protein [Roseovarius arcticus]